VMGKTILLHLIFFLIQKL